MTGMLASASQRWSSPRWRLLSVIVVLALVVTGIMVSANAAKAYPRSSFSVGSSSDGRTAGNFVWYNRSVQVGGTLYPSTSSTILGAAVVFTVYHNSTVMSRAARPCDGCYRFHSQGSLGFGFTMSANVAGGATKIVVDIWLKGSTSVNAWKAYSKTYYRP
jgi:Kef-type K+ transport system membrane component KefB